MSGAHAAHTGDVLTGLRKGTAAAGAQALLVTSPPNVRYLTGFSSPEDGRVLITPDTALLLTDFRYDVQAADESVLPVRIVTSWLDELEAVVGDGALAIEADHATVALQRQLEQRLGTATVPLEAILRDRRMTKAPFEVDLLREAARLTDLAFAHIVGFIRPGLRELDVALELERVMRDGGAEGSGFDIIVAGGPRSAMPHGVASDRVLQSGDLVTMDFGARYRGYHADMTRAVALGEIEPKLRGLHDAALEALETAVAALAPGKSCAEIDAVARAVLKRHGLDQYFTHSLGHGTGLHIHEEPRLSGRSEQVLEPGMIVTVEPGVYLNGYGGVRIEELCLITDDGFELLSRSPRGFTQV